MHKKYQQWLWFIGLWLVGVGVLLGISFVVKLALS